MKNALLILITVILVLSLTSPAFAWNSNDHVERVSSAINKMRNYYGVIIEFSDKELNLMYECTKLPDYSDYRIPPGATGEVTSLHARGNYISCQRYLYELAIAVLNSSLSTSSTPQQVEAFLADYLNSRTYLSDNEYNRMQAVNLSIKKLITTKVLYTDPNDTYELSKRKRSIKIIGFLNHLVGDCYAHATIVPASAVNYTTYNSTLHFRQADFTNSDGYTAAQKWNTFKEIITQYEIGFADLNSLNSTTTSVLKRGETEPMDLTTVYNTALLAAISKDLSSTKFEDNKNFHPVRFDATFTVTRKLLTDYNTALTAYANGTPIGSEGTYKKTYMRYYQDQGTEYTMRRFDYYYDKF